LTILALASVINYDRQSDAPIWSITSRGVNYDRNKFIIQATGHIMDTNYFKYLMNNLGIFEVKLKLRLVLLIGMVSC
jgi:hypothetical protein